MCLVPWAYLQVIDWEKTAETVTFSLDKSLLLTTAPNAVSGVTGELVWVRRQGREAPGTLFVRPVLIVHTAPASCPVECVKLVPHLSTHDPLLHHTALMLQAASTADGMAGRLYTEALTNALAVHLHRRYAVCRLPVQEVSSGLAPYKLRRTMAYIQAHLEHALPLAALADAAQTSAAHFARLFKQVTGQTPH
ncbi:MAG: AraC family transcriptional regulator [Candidatus Entotheonellia bacterium]